MKYKKLALDLNLSYDIYPQWNNFSIYQIIDIVTKKVIYRGKNGNKARKIILTRGEKTC